MTTAEKRKDKKKKKEDNRKMMKTRGMTRHHISPRSRSKDDSEENTVYIDARKHEVYHWLFKNKNPDEIVNFLIDYFWDGQDKWIFEAIAKRRTPNVSEYSS